MKVQRIALSVELSAAVSTDRDINGSLRLLFIYRSLVHSNLFTSSD